MHELTADLANRFATIALGHVEREYPNGLQHAMAGPEAAVTPRGLHPVFFGSYDWHSCVHGYWLLARLLRTVPALPQADAIRALFARRITAQAVAGELPPTSSAPPRGGGNVRMAGPGCCGWGRNCRRMRRRRCGL